VTLKQGGTLTQGPACRAQCIAADRIFYLPKGSGQGRRGPSRCPTNTTLNCGSMPPTRADMERAPPMRSPPSTPPLHRSACTGDRAVRDRPGQRPKRVPRRRHQLCRTGQTRSGTTRRALVTAAAKDSVPLAAAAKTVEGLATAEIAPLQAQIASINNRDSYQQRLLARQKHEPPTADRSPSEAAERGEWIIEGGERHCGDPPISCSI